tara:strand:+ start:7020 stop:7319 length:300 start_codon:yes stop_codon:yes gene_type:complete
MAVKKKKVITKKPAPKKSRIIAKKVSVKKPKKRKEKPRPEKYKVVVSGDGKMLWQAQGDDLIELFQGLEEKRIFHEDPDCLNCNFPVSLCRCVNGWRTR